MYTQHVRRKLIAVLNVIVVVSQVTRRQPARQSQTARCAQRQEGPPSTELVVRSVSLHPRRKERWLVMAPGSPRSLIARPPAQVKPGIKEGQTWPLIEMATRFIQANINHCARAQDLLVQSMAEWLIHIAVITEPYFVPTRDNWIGDQEGVVALVSQTAIGSPAFEQVVKGRGHVSALIGDVVVVGVYFSPNRILSDFEQYLDQLGVHIHRNHSIRVIVAGDLNAKSRAWGSPVTDARGEVLEEWVVMMGLAVLNRGSTYTCVRRHGGSIVDITFADATLARNVQDWVVLEEETLSDHRYIRFDISALPNIVSGPSQHRQHSCLRWSLKRLDRELLLEAAIVQAWVSESRSPVEVNEEVEWIGTAMTKVCDAAMPRIGHQPLKGAVYWWSAEIGQLRRTCIGARRPYTRCRRRRPRDELEEERLYERYREAKVALKAAIKAAKDLAEETMIDSLNSDPWGRPYKMVMRKLRPRAPPLTQSLKPQLLNSVVEALFPNIPEHEPPSMASVMELEVPDPSVPEVTEGELRVALLRLRSKNVAPGPDGIPGRAWVLALGPLMPHMRTLFSACLEQGQFPRRWKTGKLVLLRKEGRPADSPSAYRPIVLLDEVGKLFERVLSSRVVRHLEESGPDLSDYQFGFRRGRSTVDAVARVKALTEDAISRGEVVLAVSLDIANAFNTLPWSSIREAMRYHALPAYLRRVLEAYLSERVVEYPVRDDWVQREMSRGVPQGSVLGPLLWNIGYDWVLRGDNISGVDVTCYADDTLVTARGRSFVEARELAIAGVARVVARIRRLGLEVALNKSEALCIHGPRMAPPAGANLTVDGISIAVGSTMKYLGLVLDSRWKFEEHFRRLAPKLIAAAGALSRLLPNVGGPNAGCRRLFTGVVRSMALYGAPIWVNALTVRNRPLLRKPQRIMAVRVIRGYRTISYEAACVLAGTPPWDLDAEILASMHQRRVDARIRGEHPLPAEVNRWRRLAKAELLYHWRERLDSPSAGHKIIEAVRPVLQQWVERRHGALTFHLVQVLTGHGCFGKYLCKVARREPREECHECGYSIDTAQHTLAECQAWAEPRDALVATLGQDLSLPAIVKAVVDSEKAWKAMVSFSEVVLKQKEAAERTREDVDSNPIRRRRIGRRRAAHDRRLPP